MDNKPFVELQGVNKSFPGVKALTDVSIKFYCGKVHVLMGENGAGKSTIIKAISGVHQADSGTITVDGEVCCFQNTRQALEKGISVIHQELSVIPDLTVAENIFLGREPMIPGTALIDKRKMFHDTGELLDSIGVKVNPKVLIRHLNNGDKQMVEIARAVSQDSRMVIMDEPTSSLSDHEVGALFRVIAKLKSENVAVVYISHRMKEITEIGDNITILRDGCVTLTTPLSEIDEAGIIAMMVGREMTQFYYKANAVKEEVVLSVRNLTSADTFSNISFDLHKGEVLGVAGLIGAGRTEVMRAVFGADRYDSGEISIWGNPVRNKTPKEVISLGVGLIPEDRKNQGLLLEKDIKQNTTLASLYNNCKLGFINFPWEKNIAVEYIKKLKTKTPSENTMARNLSGGNQQKVVIAKWFAANVKILIMDEPTRGIDVNAKAEIYALMKDFVEQGGSIIMVSSDLPEILGVSNRIMVVRGGEITQIMDSEGATEQKIMQYASFSAE